jgi:hypothetical protein
MFLTAFFPGFALSLSLILAIGAQNAFVLRQGLRRSCMWGRSWLVCCLSEGGADPSQGWPGSGHWPKAGAIRTHELMRWGGVAFLTRLRAAEPARGLDRYGSAGDRRAAREQSLRAALATALRLHLGQSACLSRHGGPDRGGGRDLRRGALGLRRGGAGGVLPVLRGPGLRRAGDWRRSSRGPPPGACWTASWG